MFLTDVCRNSVMYILVLPRVSNVGSQSAAEGVAARGTKMRTSKKTLLRMTTRTTTFLTRLEAVAERRAWSATRSTRRSKTPRATQETVLLFVCYQYCFCACWFLLVWVWLIAIPFFVGRLIDVRFLLAGQSNRAGSGSHVEIDASCARAFFTW